ncbi:secreted phosphoprotein 24-like [Amblyraja radiata]|uniref:secreted phosphoprotein 24-like n=1 Tax=Amblyraja radiata TaxID=386614 RepID=UPI0014031454|nr:secreted phosphoprotein 24-like [Amblyraja radiata]
MKSFLLVLAVLQVSQYCAAIPIFDFLPIIEDALRQSVVQLNSDTIGGFLFTATSNELLHITPAGPNDLSVDLRFNAMETLCPKNSGMPIENCVLNRNPLAEMVECRSSVSYSLGTVVDVFLRCVDARQRFVDNDSASSSSESSEEIIFQRRQPRIQDEYYSSVDWNNQQAGQRGRNGTPARKKNNQKQNVNHGLTSKKNPHRKQKPNSVVE